MLREELKSLQSETKGEKLDLAIISNNTFIKAINLFAFSSKFLKKNYRKFKYSIVPEIRIIYLELH